MCKFAPGDVFVSQNSAEKRLLVKNCTFSRLHTDMGSCVKIWTRTWPCKSKSGVEARLFTVNTVLRIRKNQCSQTLFHVSKVGHREGFVR